MFHGLSRTTLNILIIGCLLFITGVHLLTRDSDSDPLPPLTLPPLPADTWQLWHSTEGVAVRWQGRASEQLQVRILRDGGEVTDIALPVDGWSRALVEQLDEPEHESAAGLVLAVPMTDTELRNAAAFIIRQQKLVAPPWTQNLCQLENPAGAIWWNRQQQQGWTAEAEPGEVLPQSRSEWARFREDTAQQLRHDLFNLSRTIDIYAGLTYHQWPDGYLPGLYQDLAQAQMTAPGAYARCRQQAVTDQQSDPQFEQQNTASVTHHRRGMAFPSS